MIHSTGRTIWLQTAAIVLAMYCSSSRTGVMMTYRVNVSSSADVSGICCELPCRALLMDGDKLARILQSKLVADHIEDAFGASPSHVSGMPASRFD